MKPRRRYMFALMKQYRHVIPPVLLPKRGGKKWLMLKCKFKKTNYYDEYKTT